MKDDTRKQLNALIEEAEGRAGVLRRANDEILTLRLTLRSVLKTIGPVEINGHGGMSLATAHQLVAEHPSLSIRFNDAVIRADEATDG